MHFVLLLTFVAAFSAGVKQETVQCADLACVAKVRDEAMAAPSCTRVRVWPAKDFAPMAGGAFVWPPYRDWQKG